MDFKTSRTQIAKFICKNNIRIAKEDALTIATNLINHSQNKEIETMVIFEGSEKPEGEFFHHGDAIYMSTSGEKAIVVMIVPIPN